MAGKGDKDTRTPDLRKRYSGWENIFGKKDFTEFHIHKELKEKEAKVATAEEIHKMLYK